MNEDTDVSLGREFAPRSRDDWLKLVSAALKGGTFDKLVATTYDGLRLEPLYGGEPNAQPIPARAPAAAWQVLQRIDLPDGAAANAEALHDLEKGASGLSLVFAGAIGCYGYGLDASEALLARVLDGVLLDAGVALELDLSPQAKDAANHIAALVMRRGLAPASVDIRFGFDPIGAMAANGGSRAAWTDLAPLFAQLVSDLSSQGFKGPFAAADARPVHAAGGSEVQELAFALSVAVAYLRALEAGGVALDAARRMIFFRLAADADQFLTIAKFRALRKLWAQVENACGLAPCPAFVSAETAWRMMTKRDPWVNMLRAAMAVFAAGLGGANSITVLPFTAALGLPDRFARRMARNTQLILLEESHLAKVSDPAAGSGAIEDLTDQLCRAAWALFQEIEASGGAATALARGVIQGKVATVREARQAAVARRSAPLTGTSEFPDLKEAPVAVLEGMPVKVPPPVPAAITFPALPRMRLAEPFEQLRDKSDRRLAETGRRPKVFLATLGRPSDFSARATFARNFFAAGGIEAESHEGFADHAAMIAAFKRSGAKLACLCSSDDIYAREAAEAAQALTAAGAAHIYLAGRPKDREIYQAAGVQTFIHTGCDALATLKAAHDMIG
ncbi:MAG: methylmalonyl-CoA mutase family protein [Xanthobacteraceae bacterium]